MMEPLDRKNRDNPGDLVLGVLPRLGLVFAACFLYLLAQAHFSQEYEEVIPPGPFAQLRFVFYLAAVLVPFLFIPSIPIINLATLLSLGALLFIALGIGADLSLLLPLQVPLLMAVTVQLPKVQSVFWVIMSNISLVLALRSHTAWGAPVNGGTPYQELLYVAVSIIMASLLVLLKTQDSRIRTLTVSRERLDRAYQKVVDANLDFQTYALLAREEAMEKERRRLAGELHDIIGYSLTNVIMLIQAAQIGKGDSEQTHAILEKARLHADESLREARHALAILRSERSDRPRGANLFLKLTQTFQEVTGISINIDFANMPAVLPADIEKIIYRLIQEGLTNAFRHGRASEVSISFWYTKGELTLRIRDNGRNEATETNSDTKQNLERTGIGLAGLREQVEQGGGEFSAGAVSGGFLLEATLPIKDVDIGS